MAFNLPSGLPDPVSVLVRRKLPVISFGDVEQPPNPITVYQQRQSIAKRS